jgi:predicted Zn-dependent protease
MATVLTPPISKRRAATNQGKSRRRTVLNVRLLVASIVALVIASSALYFWHQRQKVAVAGVLLERAKGLSRDEDWFKAAGYYQQYLSMKPEDVDALTSLADALSHVAQTGAQRTRLTSILYQSLGRQEGNYDLRLRLAENLLATGNLDAAFEEAGKLSDNKEYSAKAARIRALALYAGARGTGKDGKQLSLQKALRDAIAKLPGDLELASITSLQLREDSRAFALSEAEAAKLADEIINHMVTANPSNADALLVRYRYRSRFGLPGAADDLESALRLSPSHFEALVLKAESLLQLPNPTAESLEENKVAAERLLRRAIDGSPQDPRGYLSLSRLLDSKGELNAALAVLREGRQATGTMDLSNGLALVRLLIKLGETDEAEAAFSEVEQESRNQLSLLPDPSRRRAANQIRLVKAQLSVARAKYSEAIAHAKAVLTSVGSERSAKSTPEALEAMSMLASSQAATGRLEAAALAWQELAASIATANPSDSTPSRRLQSNALLAAADAFLSVNQPDAAIECLDQCVQLSGVHEITSTKLVQAHLLRQLRRLPAERNWSEFEQALEKAPRNAANVLAKVDYLIARSRPDDAARAIRDAEREFADEALFWRGAAKGYHQVGASQDQERALDKYAALEASPIKSGIYRANLLAADKQWDEADDVLKKLLTATTEQEKVEVQLRRIELYCAAGKLDEAMKLSHESVARHKSEPLVLKAAIQTALLCEKYNEAAASEDLLAKLKGSNDFDLRCLRVKRWLQQFHDLAQSDRQKLLREVNSLRSERPRWYPIVALAAQHADLTGDANAAIAGYRLAFDLGDPRTETIQNLINLHARAGEFAQAQEYLAKLSARRPGDAQLESMAISLSVRQNNLDDALKQAKAAVARDSTSAIPRLWLANILALKGEHPEAEKVFSQAAKDFAADARVWKSRLDHLATTGQPSKAREVIDQLSKEQSLTPLERYELAAHGCELIGDKQDARTALLKAIEIEPANPGLRLRLAKTLMSFDMQASRAELEEVLKVEPDNGEARRLLATILTTTGNEEDWDRSMRLLSGGATNVIEDDRLRAVLLTRKGRSVEERKQSLNQAKKILEGQLNKADIEAVDVDRVLLAKIYEQEAALNQDPAALEKSRKALRHLVVQANPTAASLSTYIRFLLRSVDSPVLVKLTQSQRDTQRAAWLSDAQSRLDELDRILGPQGQASTLQLRIALLKGQRRESDAIKLVQNYASKQVAVVKDDQERARLYLTLGNLYSSLGRHSDAQLWYERLMPLAPGAYAMLATSLVAEGKVAQAVEVCLAEAEESPSAAVATTLAQVLASGNYQGEKLDDARSLVSAQLKQHDRDVPLLLGTAVWHVTREELDSAIALFRRVIEIEPSHTLALNNLATLLGEREADRLEAMEYIDRAIVAAGRTPSLLDTQGTILLSAGKIEEAITSLEEAIAVGGDDPRYYFHQAAAYVSAGRLESARQAFKAARDKGLDQALLTESDKKLLSKVTQALMVDDRTS